MIPQMNSPLEQLDSTAIRDFVACPYCRRITPTQKLTVLKLQDWVGTCQLRCPECNILLAKTYALQIPSWLAKFSLLASLFPIDLFIRLFDPTFLYCTLLFWLVAAVCWYYRADHVYWNLNAVRLPPGTHTPSMVLSDWESRKSKMQKPWKPCKPYMKHGAGESCKSTRELKPTTRKLDSWKG